MSTMTGYSAKRILWFVVVSSRMCNADYTNQTKVYKEMEEKMKKYIISHTGNGHGKRYIYDREKVLEMISEYIEDEIRKDPYCYAHRFAYPTNPIGRVSTVPIVTQLGEIF